MSHAQTNLMSAPPNVRVGVGAFILSPSRSTPSNPCFLVGKRQGSHGAGSYALPGGHLEFGETPEECAAREVLEETGLLVKDIKFSTATNDPMLSENKHYITMFMTCVREDEADEPRNLEPEKCEGWEWVFWSDLVKWVQEDGAMDAEGKKRTVFTPLINLLRQRPEIVPGVV